MTLFPHLTELTRLFQYLTQWIFVFVHLTGLEGGTILRRVDMFVSAESEGWRVGW